MQRIPNDHELHFASARLGDIREAQAHLQLARENSTSRERRATCAAQIRHIGDRMCTERTIIPTDEA